jgi:lipopolysaccharide/colanic/teichoic acid biosynthesis glycosyltransferase
MNGTTFYRRCGKRLFDLALVAPLLLLSAPVLVVTSLLVWWTLGRPVLFRQMRPGLHAVPFEMLKFRTMTDQRDHRGVLLPDEQRLTSIGRFLRSTSLDELPELWHVLRGELSLVGPRPLLLEYLNRYSPEQARRHDVKPGITGWAQINGRNGLEWERKLQLDVWYVEHAGLMLDVTILLRTVLTVLSREGVAAANHATAPEFLGGAREGTPCADAQLRSVA